MYFFFQRCSTTTFSQVGYYRYCGTTYLVTQSIMLKFREGPLKNINILNQVPGFPIDLQVLKREYVVPNFHYHLVCPETFDLMSSKTALALSVWDLCLCSSSLP